MHAPNSSEGYFNNKFSIWELNWFLTVQSKDQLIIFVDTHNCKPISGSIDIFITSKCMPPIQMKDILTILFNLGAQLRFSNSTKWSHYHFCWPTKLYTYNWFYFIVNAWSHKPFIQNLKIAKQNVYTNK